MAGRPFLIDDGPEQPDDLLQAINAFADDQSLVSLRRLQAALSWVPRRIEHLTPGTRLGHIVAIATSFDTAGSLDRPAVLITAELLNMADRDNWIVPQRLYEQLQHFYAAGTVEFAGKVGTMAALESVLRLNNPVTKPEPDLEPILWAAMAVYALALIETASIDTPTPPTEARLDLELVDSLAEVDRRDLGRSAVESTLSLLQRLMEVLPEGEDLAEAQRWSTVVRNLLAIEPLPVETMNGALRGVHRLVQRVDPPNVTAIEAVLVSGGVDAAAAQLEAEMIIAIEAELAVATTNDGSEYNDALAAAVLLGELDTRSRSATPEPEWDDVRGQAKFAAIKGMADLIQRSVAHPMKVGVSLVAAYTAVTEARPFTAALLRWIFAAIRQRM